MGEIDTKPIESVQTALTFFGQRNDERKNSPTKDDQEVEKERELESLEKELANVKVQLEAKESAYKQALLKIDHHHKTAYELSTLLKNSDLQKDFYISESREANLRMAELESSVERMAYQLSESAKVQQQLSHVTSDVEIQAMKKALNEEKLQKEELLRQVSEMSEAITRSVEVEREKADALELATKALSEAQKQLESMYGLENQVMEKSAYIDSLLLELNKLKEDMAMHEKKNLDQAGYISLLETELKEIRTELGNANEYIEDVKLEMEKTKEQENDAQVEMALLKFELHKGRSKLAAAEAAETRAQSEKSALYNALQQMGLEAEEKRKENRLLKEGAISREKNEGLIEKVEDHLNENGKELENVKRELEHAMGKIGELRTRAEQAISRAEATEKTKAALEEQIRKRKEHKERRKAALAALREESISRDSDTIKYDTSAKSYQPLGKVLNMKF